MYKIRKYCRSSVDKNGRSGHWSKTWSWTAGVSWQIFEIFTKGSNVLWKANIYIQNMYSDHLSCDQWSDKQLETSIQFTRGAIILQYLQEQCAVAMHTELLYARCLWGSSPPPSHTRLRMPPPAPAYWYTCPKSKRISDCTRITCHTVTDTTPDVHMTVHYSTNLEHSLELVIPLSSWPSKQMFAPYGKSMFTLNKIA